MSFKKMFGGRCDGSSKTNKPDEQVAIWVSIGVVFLMLFLTTVIGPDTDPADGADKQTETPRVIETALPVEPAISAERIAEHLASFDLIWQTITDRHWSPEHLESVNWEAARDELRPMVEAANSDDEAAGVMRELLERLRLSHYQLIPAAAYDEQERAAGEGESGISVRIIGGEAVVFAVEPGSAAAEAGVMPGWSIVSIGERETSELLDRLREREKITGDRPGVFSSLAIEGRLTGPVGDTLEAVFLDGNGERRTVELLLAESRDPKFEALNLPPVPVKVRYAQLDSGVGYFHFNAFLDPMRVMPEFENAVNASRDLDGLIIDLRGNLGGIIMMCNGIGGWLLNDTASAELGRLSMRNSDLKLVMNRRARPYTKPVAVLIDERSISSAEILAGGLKDTGVARIFGSTSAGMSLPSVVEKLPNGDSFQYAFSNYISASGRELEKNGVEPDETVRPTREDLLAGRDPALDAAVKWIRSTH